MFKNFFSPQQVDSHQGFKRQQQLADVLAARALTPSNSLTGGIAQIANALASRNLAQKASQGLQEGRNRASEQLRMRSEAHL